MASFLALVSTLFISNLSLVFVINWNSVIMVLSPLTIFCFHSRLVICLCNIVCGIPIVMVSLIVVNVVMKTHHHATMMKRAMMVRPMIMIIKIPYIERIVKHTISDFSWTIPVTVI